MSGGRSEIKTDFLGNEYIQHYDDRGQPTGRSEIKTDFLGNPYTQHYDNSGRATGISEVKTDFLGNPYTQHYDNSGRSTGRSEAKTDFLGNPYTQHYDNSGRATGRSEAKTDFLGNPYTQHTGTSNSTYSTDSASSAGTSYGSTTVSSGTGTSSYGVSQPYTSATSPGFRVSVISNISESYVILFFVSSIMLFATDFLIRMYEMYSLIYAAILAVYTVVSSMICLFQTRKKYALTGSLKKAVWIMAFVNSLMLFAELPLFNALLFPGSIEHFVDFLRTVSFWIPLALHGFILGVITVCLLRKAGEQALAFRKVSAAFRMHAVCSFAAIYSIFIHMATRLDDSSGWFLWTLSVILLFFFLCAITSAAAFVSNIPYVLFCKYPKKSKK